MAHLDVVGILADAGVKNLREGDKEISGSCPMHYDRIGREDRHSSWSMNRESMLHNCFSCGYSGTLTTLLIDVQGYAPEDIETMVRSISFRTTVGKIVERDTAPVQPPLTEWEMANILVPVPDRLLVFRRLQRFAVEEFGIRWDPKAKVWVLPVRSIDGLLLGAQLRQKGNVSNRPDGLEKSVTLFGLHEMRRFDRVTLVESPLDAVRLFGLGIPAVSSFGAWVSPEQVTLLARNFGSIVLAMDNDKTGKESTRFVAQALRKHQVSAIQFRYDGMGEAKDPGDCDDDLVLLNAHRDSILRQSTIPSPPKRK